MYLEGSLTHFSHLFPLCNLVEHSRSSLEGFLFISFVSWQVWLCFNWLGEGSGLLGLRFGVSHVLFLGELVWECRNRATVVP